MSLRAIQPESNSYVSQIFVIRIWAIKYGGYTGSQFDELQRKITEGVVGKGGPGLMVEEWIAYCVDFLVFQHVFGTGKTFPFVRPKCLPCAFRLEEGRIYGEQLAQNHTGREVRRGGGSADPRQNKAHGFNDPGENQRGLGILPSQTTTNSSGHGRESCQRRRGGRGDAGQHHQHINVDIPTEPRAMSKGFKIQQDDPGNQIHAVKRENGSPIFSQAGLRIGGGRGDAGSHYQHTNTSPPSGPRAMSKGTMARHGSCMKPGGGIGVPEQGFKSEGIEFRKDVVRDENLLSQRVYRKASNTEKDKAVAAVMVKNDPHHAGMKRKIKVEEEEDGDSRPVFKQRR
ncbi:hypothetical protein V8E51_016907 [Hyaloscypha variabilis]